MKFEKKFLVILMCVLMAQISLFASVSALSGPSDYCSLTVGDDFNYFYAVYDNGTLTQDISFNVTIDSLTNYTGSSPISTDVGYTVNNGSDTETFVETMDEDNATIQYHFIAYFGGVYKDLFISKETPLLNNFTSYTFLNMLFNITTNYTTEGVLNRYYLSVTNWQYNSTANSTREIFCNLLTTTMLAAPNFQPSTFDSDGDLMPDSMELLNGMNPTVDDYAPQYQNVELYQAVTVGGTATINVQVTDPNIQTMILSYNIGNGWVNTTMTGGNMMDLGASSTAEMFMGTIPTDSLAVGAEVQYIVYAIDSYGNTNATTSQSFEIQSGDFTIPGFSVYAIMGVSLGVICLIVVSKRKKIVA